MKNSKVTVIWKDAVIYTPHSVIPKNLPVMTTTGTVLEKTSKFILLKDTKNKRSGGKPKLPRDRADYFFIPTNMIVSVEKTKKN